MSTKSSPQSAPNATRRRRRRPERRPAPALGLTPALVPLAIAALVAQRVRAATTKRVSILDLGAIAALGLGIPFTLTCIALLMVGDASNVYPVELPNIAAALAVPLLVHALGIVAGISPVVWRALARRVGVPEFVVDAAFTASTIVLRLVLAAAVVFIALLIAGSGRIAQLLDSYPTLPGTGTATLILLSILYLPNAAVATLSALLGGSVEYAAASASLFSVDPVALPAFPLFAAIPGAAAVWAPVLMLIPAAVLAQFFATRSLAMKNVAVVAAWVGVLLLITIPYVGGSAGAYGYIGAHPLALPLLGMAWVVAVGGIVWLVGRLRRPAQPEPEPETEAVEEPSTSGGSTKWVPPTDDVESED